MGIKSPESSKLPKEDRKRVSSPWGQGEGMSKCKVITLTPACADKLPYYPVTSLGKVPDGSADSPPPRARETGL